MQLSSLIIYSLDPKPCSALSRKNGISGNLGTSLRGKIKDAEGFGRLGDKWEGGEPGRDSFKKPGTGQLLGLHLESRSETQLAKERQPNRLNELPLIFC